MDIATTFIAKKNYIDAVRILEKIINNVKVGFSEKNIAEEFESMFPNTEREDSKFSPSFDPSGKSIIYYSYFRFDTKDEIQIECFDYSKDHAEARNLADGLSVSIKSYETISWLEQKLK